MRCCTTKFYPVGLFCEEGLPLSKKLTNLWQSLPSKTQTVIMPKWYKKGARQDIRQRTSVIPNDLTGVQDRILQPGDQIIVRAKFSDHGATIWFVENLGIQRLYVVIEAKFAPAY